MTLAPPRGIFGPKPTSLVSRFGGWKGLPEGAVLGYFLPRLEGSFHSLSTLASLPPQSVSPAGRPSVRPATVCWLTAVRCTLCCALHAVLYCCCALHDELNNALDLRARREFMECPC